MRCMLSDSLRPKQDFVPTAELLIEDLETLKVMADPLRLRIRELMVSPCTVKQIAALLEIPPTKLYYHVNLLEKHGLIVVVDARVVSGIIEKHYQVASRSIRVANHLLSSPSESAESLGLSINTLFDDSRDDLFNSIHEGAVDIGETSEIHHGAKLSSLRLRLTETEARDLFTRLDEVIQTFTRASHTNRSTHHDDTRLYKLFTAAFPTSRPDHLPAEPTAQESE